MLNNRPICMTSRHEQRTGTARVRPLTALSASRHQSPSSHLSLNPVHVLTTAGSYISRSSFWCAQRLVAPGVHGDFDYFGKTALPLTTLVKLQSLPVIRDPIVLNRNDAGTKILGEPTRSREIILLGC
jgi:hypothetical protein